MLKLKAHSGFMNYLLSIEYTNHGLLERIYPTVAPATVKTVTLDQGAKLVSCKLILQTSCCCCIVVLGQYIFL
jgi:hypothetical protein